MTRVRKRYATQLVFIIGVCLTLIITLMFYIGEVGKNTSKLKNNDIEVTNENSCICPFIYSPVCGIDNKTYSNSCLGLCVGIQTQCEGICPCTKDPVSYVN